MSTADLVLLSSQVALQRSVDVVANNIANASTTGFKREGIEFSTMMSNLNAGKPIQLVFDRSTYRDTSAGTISSTGNPLDLAIQGSGYFQVQSTGGATEYTRDGAFHMDNQGQIVTGANLPVLSDGGAPITLPNDARDITVSGDGFITAQVGTGSARAQLGKIGVVKFENDQAVTPAGNNLYTTSQTPTPVTGNAIVQGAIEQSNVTPVTELTDLIKIQRAYEQAATLISNENTRLSSAIDKLSQIT